MKHPLIYSFFLVLLGISISAAQQIVPASDTARHISSVIDTTKIHADSTGRADSTKQKNGVDTVINYSAQDSVVYAIHSRTMHLFKKSELKYQSIKMQAELVDIDWNSSILTARGIPDTAHADSILGKPIMNDGGEEYRGEVIHYNFRSKQGKIKVGKTDMENGYCLGEQIKKVDTDELFIADGRFTTCSLADPHYYFTSPRMKVYAHDKIVAEPVYFYVSDVPILALPFGVFPNHSGRSSGIITPGYGDDATYGWYLNHLGYFLAASDYWDLSTAFDIYSRGKWMNQTIVNYALRYNFTGSIKASITSLNNGDPGDLNYSQSRDYYVNIMHYQELEPSPNTSNIAVNFTFMSSTYFQNFSTNLNDLQQQNIISSANYSKNWDEANRSLTVSLYQDQNLATGDMELKLPNISFNQGTIYPFQKKTKSTGADGTTSEPDRNLLEMIGINYNAAYTNDRVKQSQLFDSAYTPAGWVDSVRDFSQINTNSLTQNFSLSISPKLGYFTISPSFSWSDTRTMVNGHMPLLNSDSSVITKDTSSWVSTGVISTGISTSTRFYGMLSPDILGITAIRQTITPSFGISYFKYIYGTNMQNHAMIGTFNIGNNFEMKVQKNDSAQTEDKIQLMNVSVSSSYDFAADSMNLSPVSIAYHTDIGSILSVGGGATYDPYAFDTTGDRRSKSFEWNENGELARLTNFNISLSTSLKGEKKQDKKNLSPADSAQQEQNRVNGDGSFQAAQQKAYQTVYDREEADFSIPWKLSLIYTFSQSQYDPRSITRSSSVNIDASFNLTEKWQISSRASYDFLANKQYIQYVNISRDLHCWQMNLYYYPSGTLAGYRFEIRVKAPQLSDLKLTKQNNPR
jgi:lipopolysaccharide assembly outer membrane protein LptD (OstA)